GSGARSWPRVATGSASAMSCRWSVAAAATPAPAARSGSRPARASRRGSRSSSRADRRDDLLGGVLLAVMPGALEEGRGVVGEDLLPAFALGIAEGHVLCRPDDRGRTVAQRR